MNKEEEKKLKEIMPKYNLCCDRCKDKHVSTLHFKGIVGDKHLYICDSCYEVLKKT